MVGINPPDGNSRPGECGFRLVCQASPQSIMDLVFHEETSDKIYAGIVLGDLESQSLLNQIEEYVNEGYVRFKIKIKPEDSYAKFKQIQAKYPDLMLLADANNSFTGDLSFSRRYFAKDVIQSEITVQHGLIIVPKGPGLGVEIDEAALKYLTIDRTIIDGGT